MRRVTFVITMFLTFAFLLVTVWAQQAEQGEQERRQGRPQFNREPPRFDPEEMIQRTVQRSIEQLKLSEEEVAVIKPMIESIIQTRMEQAQRMRELFDTLRQAVDNKDVTTIKNTLAQIKSKREENRARMETLEAQLIELLTPEQEAILTLAGVVNADAGGFFGGFGPRPQRAPGQPPQR